ncbi:Protein of unknown function [Bacillus cytotoxicus]|uniref:Uncharacterized protein n=1 Tax=Bacillus cytotoxicus TaxID=580165 RepID=A0AAX2CBG2_9BACI|nr:Protein of unknown function [Bacillus cytotoxicus]
MTLNCDLDNFNQTVVRIPPFIVNFGHLNYQKYII